MELAVKADLEGYETIDIVGTGGDGKILLISQRWLVLLSRVPEKKLPSMEITVQPVLAELQM
jgi:hypothetical protein